MISTKKVILLVMLVLLLSSCSKQLNDEEIRDKITKNITKMFWIK